jgi:hypothetical protein
MPCALQLSLGLLCCVWGGFVIRLWAECSHFDTRKKELKEEAVHGADKFICQHFHVLSVSWSCQYTLFMSRSLQ